MNRWAGTGWVSLRNWRASLSDPSARSFGVVFVLGLALSALMAGRSQVTVDQFNLLARGWQLAVHGELVPYGVWADGGGYHPGSVTSLVVGLPLLVWQHHRSPVVLVLASHVLAYLLLHLTLRRFLRPPEQLLFGLLYWLSPWRLFFSGFLWNPNFLFLAGALHLWTAYRLRARPRFWWSFLHVLGLGVAIQLHISALLLVVSSVVLWWRRYLRLDFRAAFAATVLVGLSLIPWVLAVIESPERLPISDSSLGHRFLVISVLQGVGHWLRFAAAGLNRSMVTLDFSHLGGPGFDAIEIPLLLLRALMTLAVGVLAGWANWRLWRLPGKWASWAATDSDRCWLEGVIRWSFVAALVVFALAPESISGHALLSVVHIAVLPVVLALGELVKTRRRSLVVGTARAYTTAMVVLAIALAVGSPAYRCGGARGLTAHFATPPLVADHRMFDELGIRRACTLVIDDPAGWWPDGLSPAAVTGAFRWDRERLDTRPWPALEETREGRPEEAGGG